MKKLTEIIKELEPYRDTDDAVLFELAMHLKNLENKIKGMEAQRNNGVIDAMDTSF